MSVKPKPYSAEFFRSHRAGSLSSARRMAPLILGMVPARSVVDVGCGIGAWVKAFMDLGVADAWGVDGAWVKGADLLIPGERFIAADLTRELPVKRTFDLAISMEVAEHLPEASADRFVDSLTRLAPVVVFSAAAPMQGGTDHLNEKWPAYWAERFGARGYGAIDCLRREVWNDGAVEWWYAQNTIVYASEAGLAGNAGLRAAAGGDGSDLRGPLMEPTQAGALLPVVHPSCLAAHLAEPLSLGRIAREFPAALASAIRARVRGAGGRARGSRA